MTEWEFLNEVVERADCGILLDVNNIYVSSQNHSFDPFTYVNSVPAERVAQIHIAGHSKYRKYILDTHDHPVIDPVWKLYERAIQRAGHTATLARMGRQHSVVQGSSRRGAEGQQVSRRHRARDCRMKLLQLQRTMARAVMQPLTASERMQRKAPDGRAMRSYAAIHQAQRPPHLVRAPGNLQPPILVPPVFQHDRRFSGTALGARRTPI